MRFAITRGGQSLSHYAVFRIHYTGRAFMLSTGFCRSFIRSDAVQTLFVVSLGHCSMQTTLA